MVKVSTSTQGIQISGKMKPHQLQNFKFHIPKHHRNFDWDRKIWFVDNSQRHELNVLFPSAKVLARPIYPPRLIQKILRIYYIGSTKPDFNDMARGTMNPRGDGEWFACFPKQVLEDWFSFGFVPDPPKNEADLSGDFYEILGVKRGDDQAKIKKGYRNLARQFHPDNQATGEEWKFLKVKDAYDILSDPDKKKIYDAGLALEDMMSPKSRKKVRYSPFDYIPPQRCGDIFVEAEEKLGLYFVKKIMAWHQITKNGKILETRWSNNQVKMDWV